MNQPMLPPAYQPQLAMPGLEPEPIDTVSHMKRAEPDDNDQVRAKINAWTGRIQSARKHWDRKFKQMDRDSDFARGKQWPGDVATEEETRYVANIVQRHIQGRTASLYAKNPRFVARRRPTLDFALWDENPDSVTQAIQALAQVQQAGAGGMVTPEMQGAVQQAMSLLKDVTDGSQRRKMLEKLGKTLELLMKNQISEQFPPFKKQMKQAIRRAITTSVAWVKLGYERVMKPRPEDADKIRDLTTRLTDLKRRIADAQDGEGCAELESEKQELEDSLKLLQQRQQELVREGLVFDFPPSKTIIVDKRCRQLQGFIGARWVAQEFNLTPSDVKRIYGVDVSAIGFSSYSDTESSTPAARVPNNNSTSSTAPDDEHGLVRVYEVYEKTTKQTFTLAEGCPVWLREPGEPEVTLDRFWNLFLITFNDIEHEKEIYPPSDVELLRHQQLEHNRSRQALREHRAAAAPMYAAPRGALTDADKDILSTQAPHSTVELDGLAPNGKVADILQRIQTANIDPNLYETNTVFDDILKVVGAQEANIGGTSGATATETSVAEGSRMASVSSNVDDLDDFFNELARAAGQVLFKEFDKATVMKICGPGAVWPELTPQDIADELMLEIEAGSSGKPNKSAEIKNFQDLAPILMQIPGISPRWLAMEGIRRMDDRLDLTEAFLDNIPSIMAMNRQAQMGSGDPATDPNAQGGQGAENDPTAQGGAPQPNQNPAAGAAPNPGQGMSPIG
jgi:hypothetical protein